ncbi:hypothetical protein BH09PLA1_BH09PLA1_14750 [soil metagenome]
MSKAEKAPVEQAATNEDLSRAIDGSVEKEPGEEIRSVHVYGDHYRCNFWVKDHTPGPVYLKGGRISRSKFIRATMRDGNLVVEDVSKLQPKTRSGK